MKHVFFIYAGFQYDLELSEFEGNSKLVGNNQI